MKYTSLSLAFAIIFSFFIIQPPAAQAIPNLETIETQGDFCIWLIYQIAAQGPQAQGVQAPPGPAFNGDTACKFLARRGFQPDGGWKWEEPLTRDQLSGICLGYNPDPAVDFESNIKNTQTVIPYNNSEETAKVIKDLLAGDDPQPEKFKDMLSLVQRCISNRLTEAQRAVFRNKVQSPLVEI